jgi:predicted nucleic acid-binding protein
MNLLDTDVVIEIMERNDYRQAFISPITLLEILRGIEDKKRATARKLLEESFSIIQIDNSTIETYCKIYRKLKSEGKLLPDADLLIAATAIAHNLTLETTDSHFSRLKPLGLKLVKG